VTAGQLDVSYTGIEPFFYVECHRNVIFMLLTVCEMQDFWNYLKRELSESVGEDMNVLLFAPGLLV